MRRDFRAKFCLLDADDRRDPREYSLPLGSGSANRTRRIMNLDLDLRAAGDYALTGKDSTENTVQLPRGSDMPGSTSNDGPGGSEPSRPTRASPRRARSPRPLALF